MIDEERTLEEYGYVSTDLSHGSHKPVIVICDFCGKEFIRIKKESDGKRYCSRDCKHKYISKNYSGSNSKGWIPRVVNVCEQCNMEYDVVKYRSEKSRFCSIECKAGWQSENLSGKMSPSWRGGDVIKKCKQCGKECASGFCSRECYAKWRSDNLCGEKNPNWNEGSSFGEYCEKFNEKFKQKIRDVYGGVCFVCGKDVIKNRRKMDVHHVSYNRDCMCDGVVCEFVPLCQRCHGTTTRHRLFWERLFIYSIGYYDEYYRVEIPKGLLQMLYINK